MKLVHWWVVTFGTVRTVRRGLGEAAARPDLSRCTKCNSPPINGQCTNHRIGPLLCGFNVGIKGLNDLVHRERKISPMAADGSSNR